MRQALKRPKSYVFISPMSTNNCESKPIFVVMDICYSCLSFLSQFPNSCPENVMLVSKYPFPIDNILISIEAFYIMKVHDSLDAYAFVAFPSLLLIPSLVVSLILSLLYLANFLLLIMFFRGQKHSIISVFAVLISCQSRHRYKTPHLLLATNA